MASFVNFKIDKRVMDAMTDGRSTNNSLGRKMLAMGRDIADQAKENTMTARNHQDATTLNPRDRAGVRNTRGNRWRSGEAGRYDTGELANSYRAIEVRRGSGPVEVRVGSNSEKFEWHEFGTKSTGWGRGILPGNMLRDAVGTQTGRGAGRIAGVQIYK